MQQSNLSIFLADSWQKLASELNEWYIMVQFLHIISFLPRVAARDSQGLVRSAPLFLSSAQGAWGFSTATSKVIDCMSYFPASGAENTKWKQKQTSRWDQTAPRPHTEHVQNCGMPRIDQVVTGCCGHRASGAIWRCTFLSGLRTPSSLWFIWVSCEVLHHQKFGLKVVSLHSGHMCPLLRLCSDTNRAAAFRDQGWRGNLA